MRHARCLYHCSPCGRHFHSLKAFDAHQDRSRRQEGIITCLDPLDLEDRDGRPRLVALDEHGSCDVLDFQADVVVWTLAGAVERAARHWRPETPSDVRPKDSEAQSGVEAG